MIHAALGSAAQTRTRTASITRQRQELQTLDQEMARLTTAIAQGGNLPVLLDALRSRQAQRVARQATLAVQEAVNGVRLDRAALAQRIDEPRPCRHDVAEGRRVAPLGG